MQDLTGSNQPKTLTVFESTTRTDCILANGSHPHRAGPALSIDPTDQTFAGFDMAVFCQMDGGTERAWSWTGTCLDMHWG